jgi:1-acyl-sn-glycerol-3-phosphate acyltransferase
MRIATAVTGTEHIPRIGLVVYCYHHESNVDPPVLFERCTTPANLTRRLLRKFPIMIPCSSGRVVRLSVKDAE